VEFGSKIKFSGGDKMKSKWLKFLLVAQGYRISVWRVENKKSKDFLGLIKWHPQWRQYCFISHGCNNYSIVYSQNCLRDIAEFIKKLMDERKKKK